MQTLNATPLTDDLAPELRERADALLRAYLAEAAQRTRPAGAPDWFSFSLRPPALDDSPACQALFASEPALQVAFVRVALDWSLTEALRTGHAGLDSDLWRVSWPLDKLLRRRLPLSAADAQWLACRLAGSDVSGRLCERCGINVRGVLRGIERVAASEGLTATTRAALHGLRLNLSDGDRYADGRATLALLDQLRGAAPEPELFDTDDDWGQAAAARFAGLEPAEQAAWGALLRHAAALTSAKPTRAWQAETTRLLAPLGPARAAALAAEWLRLLEAPTRDATYRRPDGFLYPTAYIAERNGDTLRGLAWLCVACADVNDTVAATLGAAGLACFHKLPMIGARSTKAGNACAHALGTLGTSAAVAQLQRLQTRVKLPSAQKQLSAALDAAAQRAGLTRADLEELAVPTFGLSDGCVREQLGDYVAELRVNLPDEVELGFRRPDGARQASAPAELKRAHAAELKALRTTQQELRAALQTQRARLERLLLAARDWRYANWRARYLEHPLVGLLARDLIWSFADGERMVSGAWRAGRLEDAAGGPLDWLTDDTRVRLWHPLDVAPHEVLAWRAWLDADDRAQPFKQARREVYLLTDAERATRLYSNRFGGHILRQHQFHALAQQRGWRYTLQGQWDGHNTPTLDLPEHGLRAHFDVDGGDDPQAPISGHAVYLAVTTGQCWFTLLELPERRAPFRAAERVPLDDVPPRVFSEVLRDLDLFVSVGSVGNDPHWLDAGPAGQRDYWQTFAYGELNELARARRETLARLLPRLRQLAGRYTLQERFLRIQGDLHDYRIHLGSANVVLEPHDQHLCIVPGGSSDLRLPFEGDTQLALILSKALLLANDRAIKDPVILRQLARAAT